MKLRIKSLFMIAAILLLSSGCSNETTTVGEDDITQDSDSEPGEDPDLPAEDEEKDIQKKQLTDRRAALVMDGSSAMDNGFGQAALKGVQTYADAACVPYSCYNATENTPDSYRDTILTAIEENAELVVCVGPNFEEAVGSLQEEYGDIYFLLLGGVPRDASGGEVTIAPNVHCVIYKEEEAGYLVGYMSVLEGYRKFGFIGGEELSSVQKYGYGYLRGIDDAADFLEVSDEVQVEYWYADTSSPSEEVEEMSQEWFQAGTEIIFVCGGMLYQSVLPAAESYGGMLIGADVDQSDVSELILTSAMKGIDSSIIVALDDFFANGKSWPEELAGTAISYGAREKCISLPVQDDAWRFKTATTSEYLQVLARLRSGDIEISIYPENPPKTAITVVYHNQQEENDS